MKKTSFNRGVLAVVVLSLGSQAMAGPSRTGVQSPVDLLGMAPVLLKVLPDVLPAALAALRLSSSSNQAVAPAPQPLPLPPMPSADNNMQDATEEVDSAPLSAQEASWVAYRAALADITNSNRSPEAKTKLIERLKKRQVQIDSMFD